MDTDRLISVNLPAGYSYGYIGNCNFLNPSSPAYRDNRYWFISRPHPGRPGEPRDQVGRGYATEDRFNLVDNLRVAMAEVA